MAITIYKSTRRLLYLPGHFLPYREPLLRPGLGAASAAPRLQSRSSGCVNRGLSPQLILLPRSAAARHRRIELGWARCIPAIGAARKADGCPVSLLCLVKAASDHPYPPIKLGCRSEQLGVPGAASGGVIQGKRETSRR